ncbi:MAG TPA: cytochrome c [Anaerolineales bacterium]|nr:cytochrome c [Anaerolineales bacterium]
MQKNKSLVLVFIIFVLVAMFLAACGKDVTKPGKAVSLTGDPAAGKVIYDGYCKSCHGVAGAGGVANPGSDDGTVPELAPIDMDIRTAAAMDLYIEHGSKPEGADTATRMPAFGDEGTLAPQQIADVISYVLSLNK